MTIRVGVLGAGGRMGQAVCQAVSGASDMALVAAVDPGFDGIDIGEVGGVEAGAFTVSGTNDVLVAADVGVVIDFTHIESARENIAFAAANGIHTVVGTSGFTEADHETIAQQLEGANCLLAPNFAIGAVLMMRFAALASPYFETAEIIELHHDAKIDSPSGTAVSTAEMMAAASSSWADDPTKAETIPGARGASGPAGIPIHSVRMRGMVAHQEVLFGTTGQSLTMRHDSYDRSSFMPGVLLGVRKVGDYPGLTVGLDKYLDL